MSIVNLSSLTLKEVQQIIRVCRTERDSLTRIEMMLQERIRVCGDGEKSTLEREIALAKQEIHALANIIAKLWTLVQNIGGMP